MFVFLIAFNTLLGVLNFSMSSFAFLGPMSTKPSMKFRLLKLNHNHMMGLDIKAQKKILKYVPRCITWQEELFTFVLIQTI